MERSREPVISVTDHDATGPVDSTGPARTPEHTTTQTLIIGCGNLLRGDDAVGPILIRHLWERGLPGDPAASAFQQVSLAGADVFRATRTVFVYPVGGPVYNPLDNESKGVSCPSGFDGDARFGGNGIRCDKVAATKGADCDFPYSLDRDRRGQEDRCLLANTEGGTKPVGITFAQMQVEKALPKISWTLDTNAGGDQWIKKEYAFPRSSN